MSHRRLGWLTLAVALPALLSIPTATRAQHATARIAGFSASGVAQSPPTERVEPARQLRAGVWTPPAVNGEGSTELLDRLPLWSAPLASLVLPGIGQARLRQGRAAAYLAVEGFLLLQYVKDMREGRRSEREYRDIARSIARRGFAASPPDTAWQYYEKLAEYVESGAYTMASTGPTVPETDTLTYNGAQWLLARSQYGVQDGPGEVGTPRYERALLLYESRAVRQPYRWSWRNAQLEKDLYQHTISRTNDAYRRATFDLSALIANHLLSAIDAFAVVRLNQLPGGAFRVSATIPVR